MTKFLSRDSILGASDIEVEEIEVPEWGGTVMVREMTTAEVEHFSLRTSTKTGQVDTSRMAGIRAEVVAWCLVGEDGEPILNKNDAQALQKKSHRVIDRLFNRILELSDLKAQETVTGDTKEADSPKE